MNVSVFSLENKHRKCVNHVILPVIDDVLVYMCVCAAMTNSVVSLKELVKLRMDKLSRRGTARLPRM